MSNIDPAIGGSPSSALGIGSGSSNDIAAQLYGYLAWATNIPEVADILKQAATAAAAGIGWSQAQMDAALEKTTWWKTTSESARTFQQRMANDPATVGQEVMTKVHDIQAQLQAQGVEVDPSRLHDIAMDALRFNMDDTELKAALDSELMREPSILNSQVGTNYKALARQYATNLSDDTIQTWAAHSISGVRSDEMFRQYLTQQAKSLFRNNDDIVKFLDAGGTVDQYGDVFKQDAAQTLGIDPNQVDFTDPKWGAALNAQHVDANGKPTGIVGAMTRQEWIAYLKSDPKYGWSKTTNGINELSQLANGIAQQFGMTPGVAA